MPLNLRLLIQIAANDLLWQCQKISKVSISLNFSQIEDQTVTDNATGPAFDPLDIEAIERNHIRRLMIPHLMESSDARWATQMV